MEKILQKKKTSMSLSLHAKEFWQKWTPFLFILGVAFIQIKKVFVDFNIDCEYAITMSYRLAMGDHMFSQMREPHQTSAFLLAIFIKLWMLITGTTTGIVLYLNVVSVIIKLLVTLFLYRTLGKYCAPEIAFLATVFFAALEAKSYILLDFSNMQIYSSVLLFCSLLRCLQNQEDRKWLCLSSICLCLEVLSYPSCLLAWIGSLVILLCMSRHKVRNILIFSAICGILGACYILFFVIRLGWTQFRYSIQEISDYMGPYIMNMDLQEWPNHIHPDDRVLIVGRESISPLKYLFESVTICADSTICTPTYNEKLLRYWEQNPDKLPNVVVVDCWFGQLNVDEDSWIMQWIYEEFGADSYEDGTYQRYYRIPDNN